MTGTLSPDGQWLWNGSEWIPAPPTSSTPTSSFNEETNVISQPTSETREPEVQQLVMQQPSKDLEFASASMKMLNAKVVSGMLISILLLGSIVYFFLIYESDVLDEDIPEIPTGTWKTEEGTGISIRWDDDMLRVVTYESDCSDSPMKQDWVDLGSESPISCHWRNADYPHFQTFTVSSNSLGPRLCFDGDNAIEGAPGGCLTFVDDFVADHMLLIDDDGECEVLLGGSIDPPSDSFDADITDQWYSDNKEHFENVKSKYPPECKSTTGPSPLNLLFEQIF